MSDYGIVTWLDRKKMRERSEIHYRPPYLNALCDLYIANEQTAIILCYFVMAASMKNLKEIRWLVSYYRITALGRVLQIDRFNSCSIVLWYDISVEANERLINTLDTFRSRRPWSTLEPTQRVAIQLQIIETKQLSNPGGIGT